MSVDSTGQQLPQSLHAARFHWERRPDASDADDPFCTECGEVIEKHPASHLDYGTGVHAGNDVGYVLDAYVHNRWAAAAKERLGLS